LSCLASQSAKHLRAMKEDESHNCKGARFEIEGRFSIGDTLAMPTAWKIWKWSRAISN